MQRITTKEPKDDVIEVAIAALKAVLDEPEATADEAANKPEAPADENIGMPPEEETADEQDA